MTRLDWSSSDKKAYEAGVDRGVLYIGSAPGVPWIGLESVQESPSGVSSKPYYVDGVKFYNALTGEDFEATLKAYTYPEEFGVCDGSAAVGNGLFAQQQRRRPFGLSYRSKIGNESDGLDADYKIHIVYGAMAEPASRSNQSQGGTPSVMDFSWHITTTPSALTGFRPTSHFVIDSRAVMDGVLGYIEDILYGNDLNSPRLPPAGELAYLFTSFNNTNFDAGGPLDHSYVTLDAGGPTTVNTQTYDGGAP